MAVARKLAPELDFSRLIAGVEAELKMPGMTARTAEKIYEPEPFSPFVHVDEPSGPMVPHLVLGSLVAYGQYFVSFEFYRMFAALL
jgi:hypothetical protein